MKANKYLTLLVIACAFAVCSGCSSDLPPNPGFRIVAYYQEVDARTGTVIRSVLDVGRTLDGDLVNAEPGATGNVGFFDGEVTNIYGEVDIDGGIAPATWRITPRDGVCAGDPAEDRFLPGREEDFFCIVQVIRTGPFFASPSSVDVNYPPSYFTIHGSGISAAGGMPWVEYWHPSGTMYDRRQAYEVAPDGSWLNVYTPDFSQPDSASGIYQVKVRLASGEVIGTAEIQVYDSTNPNPEPTPEPCPPCPSNMDCMPCNVAY